MRHTSYLTILSIVAILCAVGGSAAQTDVADKFLISAKAGGVNYVAGSVTVTRANGTSGVLLKRDRVEVGDRVSTGADGRAEVLLNPGSYIRLATNSSFEFGTTDLEDLQLKLDSGSAIFEVFADNEFRVSVSTPKGKLALIDTGVYRIDVANDGTALLSVSKGKAQVGEGNATVIKDGRTGTVGSGTVAVAKFDKGKRDEFAQWSKDRSKELIKVSSSLQDRALNNAIFNGFGSGRWNLYNSFGLWIFDARYGGFCFLPFGNGWRSPYGGWYDNGIYWQHLPWYFPRVNPTGGPATRTKVGEVIRTPTNTGRVKDSEIIRSNQPPPFTKIERGDSGIGKGGMINRNSDFDVSGGGGRSNFPTPSNSVPVYTPPAPVKTGEVIRIKN